MVDVRHPFIVHLEYGMCIILGVRCREVEERIEKGEREREKGREIEDE